MIYTGSDEIRGIMLGDEEILGIYVGDELIYPLDIIGLKVRPSTLSFTKNGGTRTLTIASDLPWTATTTGNWITLSQYSASSGVTTVDVTVSAYTGSSPQTAMIEVVQTDPTITASTEVTQLAEFEPTGYFQISGENVSNYVGFQVFNPYEVYTNSGTPNYMRFEVQNDSYAGFVWSTTGTWGSWFTYENYGYYNISDSIQLCWDHTSEKWNTTGNTSTTIVTYDNSAITSTNTAKTQNQTMTANWSGNIHNDTLQLFPGLEDRGVRSNFYRFKVYDSPNGNPIFDFCPALDGNNNPALYDAINNTYYYSQNMNIITFIPF